MEERIERFRATIPTVERIVADLEISAEDAAAIVATLKGHHAGEMTHEEVLQECDKIFGGLGVVSLESEEYGQYTDEGIRMCPPFSSCNAGDPYVMTLARDHEASAWVMACWADLAAEYEREHKLGDYEEFTECPELCPSCAHTDFELHFFQGSARGPSFSWVCDDCGHHAFAEADEDGGVKVGEDEDGHEVTVRAIQASTPQPIPVPAYRFAVYIGGGEHWHRRVFPTAQEAREDWDAAVKDAAEQDAIDAANQDDEEPVDF
jgi:hypothetical protein